MLTPNEYDKIRIDEGDSGVDISPSARARFRHLFRLANLCSPMKYLLDYGCGTGAFMAYFCKQYANKYLDRALPKLTAIDFSQKAIDIANKRELPVDYRCSDLAALSDKAIYDLIICSEVLEHIQNDKGIIRNIWNLLRPEGHVIISVPAQPSFWSRADEYSGHIRRYYLDEIASLFKGSGFKIVKVYYWGCWVYALFYKIVITKINPSIYRNRGSDTLWRKMFSSILHYVFLLEDPFINNKFGLRIFLMAKKEKRLQTLYMRDSILKTRRQKKKRLTMKRRKKYNLEGGNNGPNLYQGAN